MRSNILILIAFVFLTLDCNRKYYKSRNGKFRIYSSHEISENYKSIRAIDLSDDMNSIPSSIFQMKNLQYLNLNNKNLVEFPEDICELKSLKVLLLNGNRFNQIPECLFELNQLETVTLFGCYLDSIPHGFSKLSNLMVFGIGGNTFKNSDVKFFKENLPKCNVITSLD